MKTLSANYLAPFLETCVELGADRARLLAFIPGKSHGFDATAGVNTDKRYSIEVLFQILAETEEMTGNAEIGLKCGENLRPTSLGEIGPAITCCKSLRQVAAVNRKYQSLTQQFGRTNLKIDDDCARLLWEPNYDDPEYGRAMTDVVMAGHATFGRWLSWSHNQKLIAVHLKHKKPYYADSYVEMFDCPVLFNQVENSILIDVEALDYPLPQANETALSEICKRLDIELAKLEKNLSYQEHVTNLLRLEIKNGLLNLTQTARRLGVSPRSLRRGLAAENTSFRQILEKMRQQMCEKMLSKNMPLMTIADQLGYSQQSAFNRAFKQWYGTTPKAYVRAQKT